MRAQLLGSTAWLLFAGAVQAQVPPPLPAPPATSVPQEETVTAVDDIVVTAQRRSESAQDVPISLTVLGGETLERANIDNVLDLTRVAPSFNAARAPQAANTRLSIRGIGSSGNSAIEPSVAAFVDGIYISRPGPLLAGLMDVASVEILRGPQGTLFGRNASMGAISYTTNSPRQSLEGMIGVEGGEYGYGKATGTLNIPVSDAVAIRGSVLYQQSDGYGWNTLNQRSFGDSETLGFRGALRADLTPSLTWLLRADAQSQTGDGQTPISVVASTVTPSARAAFTTNLQGLIPNLDETYTYDARQIDGGDLEDNQWGLSSDLSWMLGDYTLRLISGYRDWDNTQSENDITLTPADLYGRLAMYESRTHSEELQLLSPDDALMGGRLSFVAGLYYFTEDYDIGEQVNLGSNYCRLLVARLSPANLAACNAGPKVAATDSRFSQRTESYAAYGQATLDLTETLSFTGGLRYSHDDKTASLRSVLSNPAASLVRRADAVDGLESDEGKFTYRANLTYRPTPDLMLFATYATGYKSGGFDANFGATLGANRTFDPETTTNYEAGVKSEFLDRRVVANATLFRTDIDAFQLRAYNGLFFAVTNAGSIRQSGIEFDTTVRPVEGLTLNLAATRLDSEYTDFRNAPGLPGFGGTRDLTGFRAGYSPRWQGSASAAYERPLSADWRYNVSANLSFQSDSDVGGAGDANPQGIQPAYQTVGARLSLFNDANGWEVFVTGDNLTDEAYCTIIYPQTSGAALGLNDPLSGGTVQRCVLGEPRNLRVGAKLNF